MTQPTITFRPANPETDRDFIFSLSPDLAAVAKLPWHTDEAVQKFQDDYIEDALKTTGPHITVIAEVDGKPAGFIHALERPDDVSGELIGSVSLIALAPEARGLGIGKLLMDRAEDWARAEGYRLLHVEVFAANERAIDIYTAAGYSLDTYHMIKPLD